MAAENTFLIVGLGNPGPNYVGHRHNIGFQVVEHLAARFGIAFADIDSVCEQATLNSEDRTLILLKPQLYMNCSGEALLDWSRRRGIELTGSTDPESQGFRPLVVCDDLSLPLGSLRLRARGSSGGQNGLDSVIQALGGQELPRLRLGIAGGDGSVPPGEWSEYVLSPFLPEEKEQVGDQVDQAIQALECVLDLGVNQAASRFNRRILPDAE
ncbi:MAG: aminoacyl-tRNA hydrolase [Gemmatimonadales bacterium]|nr:aminoacyl-tRNA hydrolase [Gemmatimonadales bacterium]